MKLSIGGYSFHNSRVADIMDVFGYLETAKHRYRLNAVDLWNGFFCKQENGFPVLPDEGVIRKIREALDERELVVANICLDGTHLVDDDPSLQDRLNQNALLHLQASETLGAKTVRIDFCMGNKQDITEAEFEFIVNTYRTYCDRAAQLGYIVGPENHMGAALNPHLLKRIAEAVDHPNFGILLHMGRWTTDIENGDAIVAPWVMHTHIDDKSINAGKVAGSIGSLIDAGYDGHWAIEYNAKGNQYAEIEWALSTVKRLLQ
ncbi:sugar phosphate isomerase/epimerase family protein [Paenibacillus tyrfis]|uniref:Xylose isomerase n=1 Tax=Paenibacillus tyrfis TaxID=1501230 RepID=A0A081NVE9_9BACL|nr:TIM barrel protein [Paenibacillus tyrfis]KEQ22422.1 xylose isomerase [Paenibacillus tyrfis]